MAVPSHIMSCGVFFMFFFLSTVISTNHACNKADHNSLWSSFDVPSSALNWSSSDCCHWEGITCDKDGRVTHLLLPSKRLQGSVSRSLGNLTHLSHLNLSHNQLLVLWKLDSFCPWVSLRFLIWATTFSLVKYLLFPPSSYIRRVDLSSNQFNGTIPSSFLQHAGNLSSLNVSKNHISGQMPSSMMWLIATGQYRSN